MSAKKNIIISITALIISACSLFNATIVKAATPWDNVIQPTQNLIIGETDRTSTYLNYMRDNCDSFYYNSLIAAMSDPEGKIAVVQQPVTASINVVTIQWTISTTATTTFLSDVPSPGNYAIGVPATYHVNLWDTPGFQKCGGGNGLGAFLGTTQPGWNFKLYLSTFPVVYPTGYVGSTIPNPNDSDSDGLNTMQEQVQGTSDNNTDSDGDGLNDFIESQWNPDRDDIFCGAQCAYPNPTTKDIYVEIDWMKDDGTLGRSYQPSTTQLNLIKDAYNDQDIIFHADTGEYGGGEQLPVLSEALIFAPTEDELDFYDLKNGTSSVFAEFDSNRKNIWRYMISGYNYMDTENAVGSTGSSYPGDDDSIISIEKVEQLNPSNVDTAVAGTILHELGHNLCLTSATLSSYPHQPSECVYSEIDKETNPSSSYESVMNYDYQFDMTDYSHGVNGVPDDHNDWQAIMLGMGDFQNSIFEWDDTQSQLRDPSNSQVSRQVMIDSIQ